MRTRVRWTAIGLLASVALLTVTLRAAGITAISVGGSLPSGSPNCVAGNLYLKTGASKGLYWCDAGTWTGPVITTAGAGARSFGITIDGAGSTITTGVKGFIQAPVSGTIASWTLLSTDASATAGSIVVEVDKDVYANYPPNGSDKICASACPTLSSVNKNTSSSLGTWTTAVTAGDVFGFNVTSVSTVSRVTLVLTYQ